MVIYLVHEKKYILAKVSAPSKVRSALSCKDTQTGAALGEGITNMESSHKKAEGRRRARRRVPTAPGLVPLDAVRAPHGGKALGLKRLMKLGIRVPSGIALDRDTVHNLLIGDSICTMQLRKWLKSKRGRLAIRSSAVNEDGEDKSFAGIYESLLGVKPSLGPVLRGIRRVSTSGMSERVAAYSGTSVDLIPVILQEQVESQVSGVLFTKAIDCVGNDCAYLEWVCGNGEALVSGRATPASCVMRWNVHNSRLSRRGIQINGAIPDQGVPDLWFALIEAVNTEASVSGWDVEWTIDANLVMWALQMRPATVSVTVPQSRRTNGPLPVSPGIARGRVRYVDATNLEDLKRGEILVAEIAEADFLPAMKRAAAIVTETGGLLSHAAIVARELGKPCVVGVAGIRSVLRNLETAEVNGTNGTLRQGGRQIGGGVDVDLDWSALYLYDRGLELQINQAGVYVEPTLGGIIAHLDADARPELTGRVDVAMRRIYHSAPSIVRSDKRIWFREWRRFERFHTIARVQALIRVALSRWSVRDLEAAFDKLKRVGLQVNKQSPSTQLERLFKGEIGAALHAMVAIEVEGHGVWALYRDSATWRMQHKVGFGDLLRLDKKACGPESNDGVCAMLSCMKVLAKVRNEAYSFFSKNGIYEGGYFASRERLVQSACAECGIACEDENAALDALYEHEKFLILDRKLLRKVARVLQ